MKTHLHKRHFLVAVAAGAAAQTTDPLPDTPNPSIALDTCKSLTCTPSNNSVCAAGNLPGAQVGVSIAPRVLNVSPDSEKNISLTLTDGLDERGFTAAGLPAYEFTDLQLFVGVDPDQADDEYASGCVLMMQYQGQTFPAPDDRRDQGSDLSRSTSCDGVLDELCQASIHGMVQDFHNLDSGSGGAGNSSSAAQNNSTTSSEDRCAALTRYINMRMREDSLTCGAHFISSFINVTGGALPGPQSEAATHEALGDVSCRPVLPQAYRVYPVARMRQFYFAQPPSESESDFLKPLFGGRAGITPVFTVTYDREEEEDDEDNGNETAPDVQFVCMRTFQSDGEPLPQPFESAAAGTAPSRAAIVAAGLVMGFAIMVM